MSNLERFRIALRILDITKVAVTPEQMSLNWQTIQVANLWNIFVNWAESQGFLPRNTAYDFKQKLMTPIGGVDWKRLVDFAEDVKEETDAADEEIKSLLQRTKELVERKAE